MRAINFDGMPYWRITCCHSKNESVVAMISADYVVAHKKWNVQLHALHRSSNRASLKTINLDYHSEW